MHKAIVSHKQRLDSIVRESRYRLDAANRELEEAEKAHRLAVDAVEHLEKMTANDRSAECTCDHTAQKKAGWDHCPHCKVWL